MTQKELGAIIYKRRKQLNISQTQFAAMINSDQKTISHVENGIKTPRTKTVLKILNALDLKVIIKPKDIFHD